jgi:hypothetical protein
VDELASASTAIAQAGYETANSVRLRSKSDRIYPWMGFISVLIGMYEMDVIHRIGGQIAQLNLIRRLVTRD